MGEVAEKMADRIVVTSDNPRSEVPQIIIDEILAGTTRAEVEIDRAEAIRRAVLEADVSQMIEYVRHVKKHVSQPVTFCENYVPWQHKLRDLVAEVDFISLHTYPVWEYKHIHEALEYTKDNVESVAHLYPGKPIVITEAGWATSSNGRGIQPHNSSEELQAMYYQDLMDWSAETGLMVFVFEAFDEPWKGSPDPLEPEKHWGLFNVDRQPKLVMQSLYADLMPLAADA